MTVETASRYIPPSGQTVHREVVQIARDGRRWSASWTIKGKTMVVANAYGSSAVPAGPERGRRARAEALLAKIVDARVRP